MHTTIKPYALRLPEDLLHVLRAESHASGKSINSIIVELVAQHVRDNRARLIEAITRDASERYAVALGKLADL